MTDKAPIFADLLRNWRQRRRLSQLDLASAAEISQRHLSFIESGRSQASREMVLRLAEALAVPVRQRNPLLLSAGFAPVHPERPLGDPGLEAAKAAVELILKAHEPYPALAVDRHWNMVASNLATAPFVEGIDASLLAPPVNVLRLSLHPKGMAPRILNYADWHNHTMSLLHRQIDQSGDTGLIELLTELKSFRAPRRPSRSAQPSHAALAGVAVPLILATSHGELTFISTMTVFGTPIDITLDELIIETFLPADAATAATLRRIAGLE